MSKRLKILHLEDNKIDVELVKEILTIEKVNFTSTSVDNQEDFINELKKEPIDIILADYSLPSFDGLSALKLTREMGITTPFILVSAVLGEELAIEALQSGATDYVLKSRMERLVPAIHRALREIEDRDHRIKLEKNITELEDVYEKIAERVRGFLKMDLPTGKFSLVDKFLEDLSGYQTKDWYDNPNFIQQIIHPDFKEYYIENFKKMQNGFVPKMLEYKIKRKDGDERWWLQFNIGAYDINQNLVSVSIVVIDNTETKESHIKYQNLFENALVGMYRTNIQSGEIIEANETMAKMFGCSTIDEFKQFSAGEFYPDEKSRNELLQILRNDGFVKGYQIRFISKDRNPIWVSLSAKILSKEDYIEGVMIDISEQKKAQEDLLNSERELEKVFEHKATATIIVEGDMTVLKCNEQLEILSGYTKEELEGKKKWPEFVHPDDLPRLIKYHKARREKGGKAPETYEARLLDKYGNIKETIISVGLIPGTSKGVVSVLDISERTKAVNELKRDRKVYQIIAEAAVQSIDIRDLCQRVLIGLVETLGYDSGSIRIYFENEKVLLSMADYGLKDEAKLLLGNVSINNTDLPLTQFLGKAIFAPDTLDHEFLKTTDIYKKYKYRSFVSWPIYTANKKFLGSIQLGSYKKMNIQEDDRIFFENISGIFSTAIERKLADEALRESEGQYRKLVDSLPQNLGVMLLQKNEIKYASPTIFNMLLVNSIKDIIGADPMRFFSQQTQEQVDNYISSIYETETKIPILYETILRRTTGEEFPAEIFATLTSFRGESAVQILIWEITDRKKAEVAIRESEEKYRRLVETSPSAIVLFDLKGELLFVNKQAVLLYGAEDETDLIGKAIYDVIAPKDRPKVEKIMGTVMDGGLIRNFEFTFVKSDGTPFQGEVSASVIKGQMNEPNAIIAVMTDLSRRKDIERQQRMLVNIVENSKEVVISADESGKIIYANAPTEEVLGYKPEELIGAQISILAPPGSEQVQQNMHKSTLASGKTTFETVRKHKDGSLIPVIMTLTAIQDPESNTTTVNAILVDISDLKNLEATLKDRSYELEVLNKVISARYITRNMNELLDFTLTTVLNSLDFNGGAIYFVNEENSNAELHRSLGFSNAFTESAKTLPIKSKAFRKLFIDGKTIFAEDYMGRSEGHKETGIKTLIGVPFFSKQKVIGSLLLSLKEKRVISKDDLAVLEAIGREVGTAVAKMRAEEELLASQKNLQTIFDAMDDFFIVFDSETGAILNVNKIVQEKLGYTIKELQKMSFFDLSKKGKKKELESIIKEVISGKIKNSSLILEGKSGKRIEDNFVFYNAKFTSRKVVIARCG